MVKGAIILKNIHELTNIEILEYCLLNTKTGEKIFYNEKRDNNFTGLYYKRNTIFFAIYPTELGPQIYYHGKEYLIHKDLSISLEKINKCRIFSIQDYNLTIRYEESPYVGFDIWSEEIDVDLFFLIKQQYKSDEFYKQYTSGDSSQA